MPRAETAALVAQLTLDDKGFNRGVDKAIRKSGQLDKTLSNVGSKAGKGLSTAAGNIAKITTIASIGAVGLLAKSLQNASDLNEEINKTKVVFGDASKSVLAFSDTTANALGISKSEALAAAGAFGNMFKTTGLAEGQAADMSKTLVTLAADMASFNNEDPSEMLDKLRSGLSGEAEPLRRFGVLLSEARVKEEAYATGIAKRGDALTEAQKVQARYSLILKDTAVQQGDFERTSGGMANLMRRLKANFKDASAVIGTALLPQITNLAVKLNDLVVKNGPAIQEFANKLPGAFDKALAFAEKIPWGAIAAGLESAAHWAGVLFDAFLGLPPEVQTTIIALAGLNKLSGGAISGIVSELGKGLIKGVLGMTAGVVNIKAGTVVGAAGGVAPVGATGGAGKLASAANLIMKVAIVGIAADVANTLKPAVVGAGIEIHDALGLPTLKPDDLQWPFGPKNTPTILPEIFGGNGALGGTGATPKAQGDLVGPEVAKVATAQNITNERLEAIKSDTAKQAAKANALNAQFDSHITAGQAVAAAVAREAGAKNQAAAFSVRDKVATVRTATDAAKAATQTVASRQLVANERLEAIRRKDFSPTVNITAKFSVQELTKGQKTVTKTFHSTLL